MNEQKIHFDCAYSTNLFQRYYINNVVNQTSPLWKWHVLTKKSRAKQFEKYTCVINWIELNNLNFSAFINVRIKYKKRNEKKRICAKKSGAIATTIKYSLRCFAKPQYFTEEDLSFNVLPLIPGICAIDRKQKQFTRIKNWGRGKTKLYQ